MAKKNANAAQVEGFTPSGIVVFPDVFETAVDQKGKDSGKYKCTFLFDKKDKDFQAWAKKVMKAAQDLAMKVFDCDSKESLDEEGIRWNPFLAATAKQLKTWGEVYEGKLFIRTASKFKPQLVDRKKNAILDHDDFYAGCMARMIFTGLFAYNVDGNQGVSINLTATQKTAEGERLGGGVSADGFDALDEEDDTANDMFDEKKEDENEDDMFA